MATFVQIVIFLASLGVVWYFAGTLVDSISRIARRYCKNGFFMAFFILGFLTSISEFAVAVNAVITGVPAVSVGNIVGASFVILLLVVPFLAVVGRGIALTNAVSGRNLAIVLATIALPVVLAVDGSIAWSEGLLAVLVYATAAYALYREKRDAETCEIDPADLRSFRALWSDIGRIALAAVVIFAAAHFLVEQAVYFASLLTIPVSLVGLIVLSIGTNIPEIVIALRSVLRGRTDIAFGDYLGSASMNTLIFGMLALASGRFFVEPQEFVVAAVLMVSGLICLFIFARSRNEISRKEGAVLLLFYAAFFALQLYHVIRFATD